jgi:hypothetical protein
MTYREMNGYIYSVNPLYYNGFSTTEQFITGTLSSCTYCNNSQFFKSVTEDKVGSPIVYDLGDFDCRDSILNSIMRCFQTIGNITSLNPINKNVQGFIIRSDVDSEQIDTLYKLAIRIGGSKCKVAYYGRNTYLNVMMPLSTYPTFSPYSLLMLLVNNPQLYKSSNGDIKIIQKNIVDDHEDLFEREGSDSYSIGVYSAFAMSLMGNSIFYRGDPDYVGIHDFIKRFGVLDVFDKFVTFVKDIGIDVDELDHWITDSLTIADIYRLTLSKQNNPGW